MFKSGVAWLLGCVAHICTYTRQDVGLPCFSSRCALVVDAHMRSSSLSPAPPRGTQYWCVAGFMLTDARACSISELDSDLKHANRDTNGEGSAEIKHVVVFSFTCFRFKDTKHALCSLCFVSCESSLHLELHASTRCPRRGAGRSLAWWPLSGRTALALFWWSFALVHKC